MHTGAAIYKWFQVDSLPLAKANEDARIRLATASSLVSPVIPINLVRCEHGAKEIQGLCCIR